MWMWLYQPEPFLNEERRSCLRFAVSGSMQNLSVVWTSKMFEKYSNCALWALPHCSQQFQSSSVSAWGNDELQQQCWSVHALVLYYWMVLRMVFFLISPGPQKKQMELKNSQFILGSHGFAPVIVACAQQHVHDRRCVPDTVKSPCGDGPGNDLLGKIVYSITLTHAGKTVMFYYVLTDVNNITYHRFII